MAKGGTIEYGIRFNIDQGSLSNLRTEINRMAKELQEMSTQKDLFIDEKTVKNIQTLQKALNSSWNNQLNQLNLTKFQSELKKSDTSLLQLKQSFADIGRVGLFHNLASELLTTNSQLKITNNFLDRMATTFGNVARYALSSKIFNNFTNSISQAYKFTVDLDTALNRIRIVSNQNAEQMERFAINANKASKALGTSTLEYAKGALIYYQQGLNAEEANKRTEVTLKMANVLGTSAQEVSNYMTAIWNNFDHGTETLEHYADVITALGAATASSSEEIATGLEKFAAVAKTIGLSYEYATTALATVVAQTRQSADTVGTAFRTIFARMEDLKLGKTLDDGTTLGKYSSTLAKIGVSIKDQNGQLKDMDTILSEMGAKWQTLSKDQQVAVAQGVAGIRQYTQLTALMDNWDKFTQNLTVAQGATGTLQKQQDIYMESFEAHLQKLKTEAERTYSVLFDADSAKGFIDLITGGLSKINDILADMGGGLHTVIGLLGQVGTIFSKQLTTEMIRVWNNTKIQLFGNKKRDEFINNLSNSLATSVAGQKNSVYGEGELRKRTITQQKNNVQEIIAHAKGLSAEEQKQLINNEKKLAFLKEEIALRERIIKQAKEEGIYTSNQAKAAKEEHSKSGHYKNATRKQREDDLRIKFLEDEENGVLDQKKGEVEQYNQTRQESLKNAKENEQMQRRVRGAIAVVQGINAITSAVKVLTNESATAKEKFTGVFQSASSAIGSAISIMHPLVGMLVQIGGSLLGSILGDIIDFRSESEKLAETLSQAQDQLNGQVNDLTNNIKNLTSAWNELQNAELVLDGCITYSQEWEEQLVKVKEQIQNILETYPDLQKIQGIITTKNGHISLDENLLNNYLKNQASSLDTLTKARYIGQSYIYKNDQQRAIEEVDRIHSDTYRRTETDYSKGIGQTKTTTEWRYVKLSEDQIRQLGDRQLSSADYSKLVNAIVQEQKNANPNSVDESILANSLKDAQGKFQTTVSTLQAIDTKVGNINTLLLDDKVVKAGDYAQKLYTEGNNFVQAEKDLIQFEKDEASKGSEPDNDVDTVIMMRAYVEAMGKIWDETQFSDVNYSDDYREYVYDEFKDPIKRNAMAPVILSYLQEGNNFDDWLSSYGEEGEKWKKKFDEIRSNYFKTSEEAIVEANQEIADFRYKYGGSEEAANKILAGNLEGLTPEVVEELKTLINTRDEELKTFFADNIKQYERFKVGLKSYSPNTALQNRKEEVESVYKSGAKDTGETVAGLKDSGEQLRKAAKKKGNVLSDKDVAQYAVNLAKFSKNMDAVNESLSKNKDLLKKWKAAGNDYSKVSREMRLAAQDFQETITKEFGVEIPLEKLRDNLGVIEKALKGDQKALVEFQHLIAEAQIQASNFTWNIGISEEEQAKTLSDFQTLMDQLIEDGKNADIGVKVWVDDDQAVKTLNKLIESSGWTKDQVNEYLSKIGFEGDVETIPKEIDVVTVPAQTITLPGLLGGKTLTIPAQTTKQIVQVPYVKSVKKGSGFSGYKPSSTKSSGGGKKGGGGSSSKPKTIDKIDDEADRYHKVNTQISKVENQLKKTQSQQQKLVGAKLIENLNKQWNLLNIQVQNYNEKLKIAQGEQNELATKLKKQGVTFNADGTIANYMEAFQAQENYVNSLINQYNKLSKKQQETWDNNKTIENAKENFNKFKENMDRYDTLIANEIPGLEQSILDSIDQQIEINVQKFNLELTITLNMNQATRDWNAWKKKVIDGIKDDDILGNSRARLGDFSTYFRSNGAGDIQAYTRQVNNILKELKEMDETGSSTVYGDNRQKALDELKEKYTSLMESMTSELELEEELYQNILDEMDKVQEKFDQQIESYQFLRDILNHDIKVIQMVYGEDSYGDLAKFYESQQKNYENQLDFQRQQKEFWYAEMQAAEKGSEEWEKAKENWVKAVNEFNNILEEGLENAKNKFQNAINDIFKNLNNTVTGGMGLDYVNEQWNLINQNADRYLDTINKSYGIRALERKYIDTINKSTNINAQQKLKKIMDEQLEDLKQRDRLTQYDLDRANKLYDIELARLALEEAQMNKSQMRLRRDSQGNYTYQYVANDDKIAEAEAKIEDLYNQLYNFDKERYNAVLNDAYNAWNEYQQKMAEAAMINDPQQRAEREMLIQEEYDQLLTQIEQDYQISRYTLQQSFFAGLELLTEESLNKINTSYGTALVNADGTTTVTFDNITNTVSTAFGTIEGLSDETFGKLQGHFDELSDKERAIVMDSLVPTWNNGISQMVQYFIGGASGNGGMQAVSTNFKDAVSSMQELFTGKDGKGGFVNATKDGWDKIKTAEHTYQTDLGALEKVAGQTFDKIKKGEDEAYQKAQPLINKNEELIKKYGTELGEVKKVYEEVMKLKGAFDKQYESAKKAADEAYRYNQQELERQRKEAENLNITKPNTTTTTTTNTTPTTTTTTTTTTNTNTNTTGGGNGKLEVGDDVTFTKDKSARWAKDEGSGTKIASWVFGNKFYVGSVSGSLARIKDPHGPNNTDKGWTGWIDKKWLSGYDTGGYTGSWGNSGRLAMLHQKELVLNAQDTENMLNTVAIMRGLAYSLGSNMLSRLAGATATGYSGGGSDNGILEQNVHIDATFPNVKNATEIEEALNNLVNAASQRAYKRR